MAAANAQEGKLKALQAAMSKIEKDFGKGAIMKLGDESVEKVFACQQQIVALILKGIDALNRSCSPFEPFFFISLTTLISPTGERNTFALYFFAISSTALVVDRFTVTDFFFALDFFNIC